MSVIATEPLPAQGHFGPYDGRYVPETLIHPLQELEAEYFRAQHDLEFQRELSYYLTEFVGHPTPLYSAERVTRDLGGSGEKFNWDLAIEAKKFGKPVFLAGGLTPDNVADAVRQVQPFAVDVSSGVESAPGKKDHQKIRSFVEAVRHGS
jgi:phosphoribosylanthranilate isomerase